ncbi:hypothetical protein K435DRAFT_811532 [Dendrothele bispora CBS 962.96]|uniref:Uncharacterized protein n=1 Tax=Dendrothele bispora (strain CBS 962.96) TaxID=1314807 RepID=A0A4S8KRZ9_DENBC|nr:hypothetical protein K435DRAFT_811532 [Dendrothele bispora CBS 962.96]
MYRLSVLESLRQFFSSKFNVASGSVRKVLICFKVYGLSVYDDYVLEFYTSFQGFWRLLLSLAVHRVCFVRVYSVNFQRWIELELTIPVVRGFVTLCRFIVNLYRFLLIKFSVDSSLYAMNRGYTTRHLYGSGSILDAGKFWSLKPVSVIQGFSYLTFSLM